MPSQIEVAQQMLDAYMQAEAAILQGKEVRIGGAGLDRSLKLEDLDRVRAGRLEWQKKVDQLQEAGRGVPRFGGARFSVADVSNPHGW
jgi:hypothetical protein